MTEPFTSFSIIPEGDQYLISFAMKDGTTREVRASFEQLDQLAEEIDRRLDADEDSGQL